MPADTAPNLTDTQKSGSGVGMHHHGNTRKTSDRHHSASRRMERHNQVHLICGGDEESPGNFDATTAMKHYLIHLSLLIFQNSSFSML